MSNSPLVYGFIPCILYHREMTETQFVSQLFYDDLEIAVCMAFLKRYCICSKRRVVNSKFSLSIPKSCRTVCLNSGVLAISVCT